MRDLRLIRLLCGLWVLLALLLAAGPARAAAATWLPAQVIEPSQNSINGLSCASPTTCLAASSVPVVQDNGLSYEPAQDPDPNSTLNAVSCAPGSDFCMFVDNNGGALAYQNGSFAPLQHIEGDVELDSVSCPSASLCMVIDHNHEVFKYSNGSWDAGTNLTVPNPYTFENFVNVSCATATFCVALVSTDAGELYYTWDGSWSTASSPFDPNGNHTVSLTCTSTSFCLETDETGYASVFDGNGWSAPEHVDSSISSPTLYSSCAGTTCVAVDYNDNFFRYALGAGWTSGGNLHASTLISGIGALACATATLCVAGDGVGDATTYAVAPGSGKPALAGTATVGQTLTLTHAAVLSPNVWYFDDWRRCANPDATCTLKPISTSGTGYKLTSADANKYIDVRETVGFGFDEEGPILSNIVGPVRSGIGKASPVGAPSTSRTGTVTLSLRCAGGPCKGTAKLTYRSRAIGSTTYTITAGQTAKIKIKLTDYGLKQLKRHGGRLTVKLGLAPATGPQTTYDITLKANL